MDVTLGVVGISIQLASSVKKLIDLLDSIQQAPDEIEILLTDLRLLSTILNEIENQSRFNNETIIATLNFLFKKITTFTALISKYEPGLHSNHQVSRKWNAVKAAFQNKTFKKLRNSITDTRITLTLA